MFSSDAIRESILLFHLANSGRVKPNKGAKARLAYLAVTAAAGIPPDDASIRAEDFRALENGETETDAPEPRKRPRLGNLGNTTKQQPQPAA